MKTTHYTLAACAAVFALTASQMAMADLPRKEIHFGAYGGLNVVADDWQLGEDEGTGTVLTESVVWGIRVGGLLNRWVGLEANAGYVPAETNAGDIAQIGDFGGSLILQATGEKIAWYAMGGGGVYSSSDTRTGSDVDGQAHAGIGFKAAMTQNTAFRLQARWVFTDLDDDDRRSSMNVEFTIGLDAFVWRAQDDKDQDGITDDDDRCPTVPGAASAQGCPDSDGDGIADADDACPKVPGVASAKGCPDADGDGITDAKDACPKVGGPLKHQGCPDKDGDGIIDRDDACPDVPGVAALKGCPDADGDGITDSQDKCPKAAGPKETGGCPDTDKDGIADKDDKCPKIPGIKSLQGCLPKAVAEKFSGAMKGIYFKSGSARIKRQSFKVLDEAVALLKQYPTVRVRIEGHTDDQGPDASNLQLSKDRAASVRGYLIEKGVGGDRMVSVGFGEAKPVADNTKRKGRAENRRIEFKVITR